MFEIVHTVTDYYDGPRKGIANCLGKPHLFESVFDHNEDDYSEAYLLMPIDSETLKLALEDWTIWRRWEAAYYSGKASADSHPALPDDRARHSELESLLMDRLTICSERAIQKHGNFRVREDSDWSGFGMRPLEVEWTDQI